MTFADVTAIVVMLAFYGALEWHLAKKRRTSSPHAPWRQGRLLGGLDRENVEMFGAGKITLFRSHGFALETPEHSIELLLKHVGEHTLPERVRAIIRSVLPGKDDMGNGALVQKVIDKDIRSDGRVTLEVLGVSLRSIVCKRLQLESLEKDVVTIPNDMNARQRDELFRNLKNELYVLGIARTTDGELGFLSSDRSVRNKRDGRVLHLPVDSPVLLKPNQARGGDNIRFNGVTSLADPLGDDLVSISRKSFLDLVRKYSNDFSVAAIVESTRERCMYAIVTFSLDLDTKQFVRAWDDKHLNICDWVWIDEETLRVRGREEKIQRTARTKIALAAIDAQLGGEG